MIDIHNLRATSALLDWDQEVCMPPLGAKARGSQLATVNAHAHVLFTSSVTEKLLDQCLDLSDTLSADELAYLHETNYDYRRAVCLPENLVRKFSETKSAAYNSWLEARKQSDFPVFLPYLQELIKLSSEMAEHWGYQDCPYDALLENHERGATTNALETLFAYLAQKQTDLLRRICASSDSAELPVISGDWDIETQRRFTEHVLRDLGYDFNAGRQDVSAHPFTTNFSIGDVRITTRFSRHDLFSALFSSIHECGHALYEQGFSKSDEGTVLAAAPSLGMHESQSRLWENMIGRSLSFWKYYAPVLRELFAPDLDRLSAEDLFYASNRVSPSLIRVEADECSYNLHVIMRFEIEKELFSGNLQPEDLPIAWRERIRHYLGLEVPDDSLGCLQDIHWSHGSFGYFPTYALGNLYAAQLLEVAQQQIPDLWNQIEHGEFCHLLSWLRHHIHSVGRRMTAPELINAVTGTGPDPKPFLSYLENKYCAIYQSA